MNNEYGELFEGLMAAERALRPGGQLAVVTFHSVEDRMVKRFLTARSGGGGNANRFAPETHRPDPQFTVQKRKAIGPDADELAQNPRSRSAKLRVGIRTQAPSGAIDAKSIGMPMVRVYSDITGGHRAGLLGLPRKLCHPASAKRSRQAACQYSRRPRAVGRSQG